MGGGKPRLLRYFGREPPPVGTNPVGWDGTQLARHNIFPKSMAALAAAIGMNHHVY